MSHPSALTYRRLLAQELDEASARELRAHAEGCPHCRSTLEGLEAEQKRFAAELPLERFVAGVERAIRRPAPTPRPQWSRAAPALGLVAASVLAVVAYRASAPSDPPGFNRLKGGASAELVVAEKASGPQRRRAFASPLNEALPESLRAGARVRIGVTPAGQHYVLALSLDERGEVTALLPEEGQSVELPPGNGVRYLPGSWEFTGAGLERIFVVLSEQPLEMRVARAAAAAAFQRAGGLAPMGALELPGTQQLRLDVEKP